MFSTEAKLIVLYEIDIFPCMTQNTQGILDLLFSLIIIEQNKI